MKIAMTGGHHSSAMPVIKNLRLQVPNVEIVWYGHRTSMKGDKNDTLEYKEVTGIGISFVNLHAGKVYKTFNIVSLLKVPLGFFQALYYLANHKPELIVSFGGYLAVPVVLAGWILGIPCVTHEQTVVVGYANRVISFFAKKILVSWETSIKYFPKHKVIYTGLPLRDEIFKVSSNTFEIPNDLPTIYITAGKTGSHIINMVVKESLLDLLKSFNVIHQCGDHSEFQDAEALASYYSQISNQVPGKYYARKFVMQNEIGEVFAKSSAVVTRSGAHIVSELMALHKPSVLIPIPWVSHNEQLENARILEHEGLGILLEEKNLSKESLIYAIQGVLSKPKIQATPVTNNAAEIIVREIINVYRITHANSTL